jgi:cytidine deaminase
VGAAARCSDGTIVTGANVENASYGLSMCAERVALQAAAAAGHRRITLLAVTCVNGDRAVPQTLMPCGACRQVMSELMQEADAVIVDGVGELKLSELLPGAFGLPGPK